MKAYGIETKNYSSKFCSSEINSDNFLEDLHDYHEIAFFIKADINIFIGNSKYDVTDGDLIFIKANDLHHIFYNPTMQYVRYVVHFRDEFIIDLIKLLHMEALFNDIKNTNVRKVSINLKRINHFEAIFQTLSTPESAFDEQKSRLNLTLLLIEYYEELKKNDHAGSTSKKNTQISKIIEYIDVNYCNTITLDMLEKSFFLNKYYISHIFKEITGFTVIQYIQHRRAVKAQMLLKHSDKEIMNICYECGFNSLQDFYRVFGKIVGISPQKYRK